MSRNYYTPSPSAFQYTATGDSSSGGGSGSGMECLQLRSPPAPFHYHISDQAKSLVALQELQNEVGALLEFRDLVIETFPNLRSKLASGAGGGVSVGSSGTGAPPVGVGVRRDWEPGVRVRRKVPPREADSLPRSRSDSHSKPPAKSEGAHSVVQDSGFSTETSSSKDAHSTAAPPTRQPAPYEVELWQLLDVIQIRGRRLRDEAEALRGAIEERRSHSLNALSDRDDENDPSEEFRRALASGSIQELDALRRERDLLLDRLAELEAEALAGRVEAERLGREGNARLGLDQKHEYEERTLELRSRPSAPGPARSPLSVSRHSVFAPVTPVKSVNSVQESPRRARRPASSDSDGEGEASSAFGGELGKLDKVMNTPVRNLKVKTPDSRKFCAILRENNPIELQRHLLMFTVHNQILQGKLDKIGRTKGTLVERLHRTREENDDLRFQLEEKTIELEGTRAHMRLLESGRRPSCGGAPRSMRALQPLPLHLQLDEDLEPDPDPEPENDRITDTPRRRPSKIPLRPSKQSPCGLTPKPPTGRSRETPSYRSRSGDSLGRPSSAQSWRNKSDANSLSGSKSGNSISSTKCQSGGRNSSFSTLKSSTKDSFNRSRDFKPSKDSLTGKVRNNDSLSRIRDSNLSGSTSVISKGSKKDSSCSSGSGKKSSVPVRRASSSGSSRLNDSDTKANGVFHNPWKRTSHNGVQHFFTDSLNSECSEQETVQSASEDRQLLHDFITRSDQLAKDKRVQYLTSNLYHNKVSPDYIDTKEDIDCAYESPNNLRMHLNNSFINPKDFLRNDLATMDISTLNNKPTKSDVLFFNQPLYYSYQSIWSRQPQDFFDSISNSGQLDSNYCSTLQSITNDSVKREGLAECDSLERKISIDDIV